MQFQKLDWSIFDLTFINLGRVDLCYNRELKENDKDLHLFFENSYKQINSKNDNPTAKIGNNILRIGKRSSSNFFRIYLKSNGKELLTRNVYNQAIRLFNLENFYCDWLLANFRDVKKPMGQGIIIIK